MNVQTTIRTGVLELETDFKEIVEKPESTIHLNGVKITGVLTDPIAEDSDLFVEDIVNLIVETMEPIVMTGDIDESNVTYHENNGRFTLTVENIFTNPCTKSEFEQYVSECIFSIDEMYEELYETADEDGLEEDYLDEDDDEERR